VVQVESGRRAGGFCPTSEVCDTRLSPWLLRTFCRHTEYREQIQGFKCDKVELKYDDLDNKLLEMGLCSARADNVAQYYIKQPNSQCATLARAALEGNPEALLKLQDMPTYCTWHYSTPQ
jgi:hypothetical protein